MKHAGWLIVIALGVACHKEPPEVERFLGIWAPHSPNIHASYELKSGGRYVIHTDTGNVDGTWTLVDSNETTTVFETHVGDVTDHLQVRVKDDDHVVWTSLNSNDTGVFERR